MKKTLLLILTLFVTSQLVSHNKSTIPAQGLVAYYPFNGNANDSSGNGNNGAVAAATLTADRFGSPNSAYSFDGSTSIIRCGDILDSVFSAPIAKFSVSGWAMTRTYGSIAPGGGFIIGKNGGGNAGPYQWNVTHLDGVLCAAVMSDTLAQNYVALTSPIAKDEWFHFVLVFDGSLPEMQRVKLYVNGQSSNSSVFQHVGTLGTATENSSQLLTIGASHYANHPDSTHDFYDGNVDDIRIYNWALDDSSIQSLYHEGGWKSSSQPNLALYYPFNGNANDSSGNGNNGAVAGATLTADRFGTPNSAYSFDGSTSIIRCGDILDSVFSAPVAKFSVSGWAMTRTYGSNAGGSGFIIGKNGGGNAGPYQWNVTHEVGVLTAYVMSDTLAQNYIALESPMTKGQWFHFVLVFDGSLPELQRIKLYVNGQSSNSSIYHHVGTLGTTTVNSQQPLTIGATYHANTPDSPGNFYDGNVDDIRIYNYALDSVAIQFLYHEGGWPLTLEPELAAYYPCNGNANDSSGNGYNGVVAGATLTTDRFGLSNSAYRFNGTSSVIRFGDILDSDFSAPVAKFSISGWANTRSYKTLHQDGGYMMGKNAGGSGPYQWGIGHYQGLVVASVFSDTNGLTNYMGISSPMGTNEWFHFVYVFDGSQPEMQRLKLYLNGRSSGDSVLWHVGTIGTTTVNTHQQFTFGASHARNNPLSLANFYDGDLDDIRIYNYALDSGTVQSLYHERGWPKSSIQPPHAAALENVYEPNAGSIPLNSFNFSSTGSYSPNGTIDSVFWFVNDNLVSKQPNLIYSFAQGTNLVKLVVQDNVQARDSSTATVNRSMFKDYLNGPVYAGPSILGNGILYVIGTGDAVYKLDSAGNVLYSLQVNGEVKSSSTIAYDTTVYIGSSDKNLYAFSKSGNELWSPLAIGGGLSATPVVDSISNQLYIGVSNKNFVAVNKSTGTVSWNYFADAPIATSAAITPDRKLIFATVKGTVYGFDLANQSNPPAPAWEIPLYDSIYSSPAVDNKGFTYFCTMKGKIYKISMLPLQQAAIVWQAQAGGAITGSPVIDGNGTLYVGCGDSKLYAIDAESGNIKWTYPSGSPIFSTPTVSDIGMIYFGNHSGKVVAMDSSSVVHWYYQDSTSVDAPLLYNRGTLYVGTVGGRLLAFYDDADSSTHAMGAKKSGLSKVNVGMLSPVWGTFHGNNQRTGVFSGKVITKVNDKTNLLPNEYSLLQNYPNPFNPATKIDYNLPMSSFVTLKVYDVLGREVKALVAERQSAGLHSVILNAEDLPSGVYFYRLSAGRFVATRKLMLIK